MTDRRPVRSAEVASHVEKNGAHPGDEHADADHTGKDWHQSRSSWTGNLLRWGIETRGQSLSSYEYLFVYV